MKTNIKFSIAFALVSLFTLKVDAQVKIGSNPTTINTNTNLEVEATDATRFRVNKDNGNVGIGTIAAPSNKLQVRATVSNSFSAKGRSIASFNFKKIEKPTLPHLSACE